MGRQRTIDDAEFWRSPRIANRSQEDKATLLYLLTSPYSNIIGVYPIVPRIAASEMGWTADQLIPVLERLASLELISFDEPSGFVWVRIWWYHNRLRAAFLGLNSRRMQRSGLKAFQASHAGRAQACNSVVARPAENPPCGPPTRVTLRPACPDVQREVELAYAVRV